ncbi:enoyl-CoA hydratase/isomerase family protein [Thermoleophilia bacterium SCSIO 60948]|nr:enoyl-CoA hydratase/isomerase family protein [Thermoleophilia bacterium SCSIO 60948]
MSDPIRLERDGGVLSLVLDNPPVNLFDAVSWGALEACLDEIEASDARALVWRAEGDIFSGGVDVKDFKAVADSGDPERALEFSKPLIDSARRIERLPIPTLALCQGTCLTAGLEIALACDQLWASESARFGLVEKVVGLSPGMGGTQRFAERAGSARAKEFVFGARLHDAAKLERWNVVNRVVPDDKLRDQGMAYAAELASGPTLAHAMTKRIVRAVAEGGVEEADRITAEHFAALFATEDLKNAVESFLSEGPGKATYEGR